jgi:Ca2+-binding RTX toxin-like protein
LVEYDGEAADNITINGTAGNDTTVVNPTSIGTGTFRAGLSPLFDFRHFTALTVNPGTGGFDLVQIDGTAGPDTVTSNATTVTLGGTVTIGAGMDRVVVNTYDGDDNIDLDLAVTGLEKYVYGGGGNDNINLAGVAVDPADPTIYGGDGNDVIVGSPNPDDIFGGSGNDTITAGVGADSIFGEADSDTIIWNNGDGSDLMEGGTGNDHVVVNGAGAASASENYVIQANGTRVSLARTSLVAFTLDIAQVEQLSLNTSSSSDNAETVVVNSLLGTELAVLNVDAGTDSSNTMTLNASVAGDVISVGAHPTDTTVEQYLGLGPIINGFNFEGAVTDRVGQVIPQRLRHAERQQRKRHAQCCGRDARHDLQRRHG